MAHSEAKPCLLSVLDNLQTEYSHNVWTGSFWFDSSLLSPKFLSLCRQRRSSAALCFGSSSCTSLGLLLYLFVVVRGQRYIDLTRNGL